MKNGVVLSLTGMVAMRRRDFIKAITASAVAWPRVTNAQNAMADVALGQSGPETEIAPNGKLRSGSVAVRVVGGVAEPVGKFIATKLGVSFEPIMYPNPDAYVQSFGKGEWDIAIGPRILAATEKADLGADVWLIDLIYVAAPGLAFADASQVDQPGVKVGVVQGSPSDRYLRHNLKSAEIMRIPLSAHISDDVIELLHSGKTNVFGADSGISYAAVANLPGAKIVPGAYNIVRIAVALPKGRSSMAQAKLAEIVNEAKQTGVVQMAIDGAGLKGVHVAPD